MISPKLVEVGRHLNIELLTNTQLEALEGEEGDFTAKITENPRYIDIEKCTSCGECAKVCPVEVPSEHDKGLSMRKAAFKQYEQAIPGAYGISKRSVAPCKATCPAHVSIQGFVALMNQGKHDEALKLFKQEHPFPGSCGRVCHHPCEAECTRGDLDEPVAIQYLHRFLSDLDLEEDEPFVPEIEEKRDEKVAVVGSGPAGLSAAYFLAIKGYTVKVFEKLEVKGGMMAVGIPEYRLPKKELEREISIIEKLGVEIETGVEFGRDVTLESLEKDGYSSVFVATGLHGSRSLGIEGEDLSNVTPGVGFLRDAALGKAPALSGKAVVIGGGNVAVDVALTAKRLGAEEVSMVCLEARDEMPAWEYEIEEALEEKVTIVNSLGPKEFVGKNGNLSAVEFKRCTSVFDEQGRFNPAYDENDITSMDADHVIVAIGQMGEMEFAEKESIPVSNKGGLEADPVTLQTSNPRVFAGGDAYYGPKSVVDAVASGKEAAESIHRFIRGEDLSADREKSDEFEKPEIGEIPFKKRVEAQKLDVEKRAGNFSEITYGISETEVVEEVARCLSCGVCSECYQCVDACLAEAIDHEARAVQREVHVGSVILAPGSRPFDPSDLDDTYMYKRSKNVLTSLEFERILSAGGPTMGHLVRPSDEKEPEKIAWLQCVGSRDTNRCNNGYCSSVCCMYAIKDAMIAKEHSEHELDCAIFNMDIRTFGKDYEKYYLRGRDEAGIRFVRSRIHSVDEVRETGNLILTWADEEGSLQQEEFDMVVLSVGLEIPEETVELAGKIGVDVNESKFARTSPLSPLETTRPGVFVSGVFQGPKDIPSSVTESCGAACAAGIKLASARNTLTRSVEVPQERDVSMEEPRIGGFVCRCGINIAGVVDVDDVVAYTKSLPGVAYTGDNLFTCSQDAQDQIREIIDENQLNRVVVASCTPKTHEPIFMDTLEKSGLNKYLFEMANIRNQNSWMHFHEPEKATLKAKDLIRMAVARSARLKPLHEKRIPITERALVIGGGVAGMTAAKGLADQGFEVVLLEKEDRLGGLCNKLSKTIEGEDIKRHVQELAETVENHEKIQVLKQALIVNFSGYKGNFKTEILVGPGMYERKVDHGVMILATGANEYSPVEYRYGESDNLVTQIELADRLGEKGADDLNQVVMIQCVGSRDENNPNCSRICCQSAIKNALHIKELNPETQVYVLYRDIRTYSMLEEYYKEARNKGVLFFRFDPENPPEVEKTENGLSVTFEDHVLKQKLTTDADLVALSAGMEAADTEELSSIIKMGRNTEGYFMEAHVKLRPVDSATEGVFICGTAHGPKLVSESIAQAMAAASRATTFLSQEYLTLSAVTAEVEQDLCASCLICVRSCPYDVPRINEQGVSEIDPALCQGCGVCASECPAKAISLNWYEDEQLTSKIDSLLEGVL